MNAIAPFVDKPRGNAQDDDGAAPLQDAVDELQRARDGGDVDHGRGMINRQARISIECQKPENRLKCQRSGIRMIKRNNALWRAAGLYTCLAGWYHAHITGRPTLPESRSALRQSSLGQVAADPRLDGAWGQPGCFLPQMHHHWIGMKSGRRLAWSELCDCSCCCSCSCSSSRRLAVLSPPRYVPGDCGPDRWRRRLCSSYLAMMLGQSSSHPGFRATHVAGAASRESAEPQA